MPRNSAVRDLCVASADTTNPAQPQRLTTPEQAAGRTRKKKRENRKKLDWLAVKDRASVHSTLVLGG
jgi:hypothetical protein